MVRPKGRRHLEGGSSTTEINDLSGTGRRSARAGDMVGEVNVDLPRNEGRKVYPERFEGSRKTTRNNLEGEKAWTEVGGETSPRRGGIGTRLHRYLGMHIKGVALGLFLTTLIGAKSACHKKGDKWMPFSRRDDHRSRSERKSKIGEWGKGRAMEVISWTKNKTGFGAKLQLGKAGSTPREKGLNVGGKRLGKIASRYAMYKKRGRKLPRGKSKRDL